MPDTFWVNPVSDDRFVKLARSLARAFPKLEIGFVFAGDNYSLNNPKHQGAIEDLGKNKGYSVSSANFVIAGLSVNLNRSHNAQTPLTKLQINRHQEQGNADEARKLVLEITKRFGVPPHRMGEQTTEPDFASHFSQIEGVLAASVDRFAELQSEFSKKNEQLREQHRETVEALKSEVAGEKEAFEKEISKRQAELDAAKKQLDDRSNTHARRAIRNDIKGDIDKAFQKALFSKVTSAQRFPVRLAFWLAILLLGLLSALTLSTIREGASGADLWIGYFKSTITGLGAVGFLAFYIRWETAWTSIQGQYEKTLATTKIDIDRASWIIESLLEWQKETPEREIPSTLLESLTRRLFDWDSSAENDHSNADDLASAILGSAARVRIGPEGASVDLDRKGVKQLEKD